MSDVILVPIDPDLESLIPGFLANRRRDVVSLRELLAERAYVAIRLIGHSMKGAGGGYGFDPITDYGDRIEAAALAGDDALIQAATAELEDYLARVRPVLANPTDE